MEGKRCRTLINYATLGDISDDDDFEDFTPPSKKVKPSKEKVTSKKSKEKEIITSEKQTNIMESKLQIIPLTSTQITTETKLPTPRLSPDEKLFQRDLNAIIKMSMKENTNNEDGKVNNDLEREDEDFVSIPYKDNIISSSCEAEQVSSYKDEQINSYNDEQISSCRDEEIGICEVEQVGICEVEQISLCEDEEVGSNEDNVPHGKETHKSPVITVTISDINNIENNNNNNNIIDQETLSVIENPPTLSVDLLQVKSTECPTIPPLPLPPPPPSPVSNTCNGPSPNPSTSINGKRERKKVKFTFEDDSEDDFSGFNSGNNSSDLDSSDFSPSPKKKSKKIKQTATVKKIKTSKKLVNNKINKLCSKKSDGKLKMEVTVAESFPSLPDPVQLSMKENLEPSERISNPLESFINSTENNSALPDSRQSTPGSLLITNSNDTPKLTPKSKSAPKSPPKIKIIQNSELNDQLPKHSNTLSVPKGTLEVGCKVSGGLGKSKSNNSVNTTVTNHNNICIKSSPRIGLRLGLSRKANMKSLHPNAIIK